MTHMRARRLRRSLAVLLLAGSSLASPGRAVAKPPGLALVIGISRGAGPAGEDACGSAARSVSDRLSKQGLAVQAVLNPSAVVVRSAIDRFAAQVEGEAPGTALIYVCGPAVTTADRLFLIPSDAGPDGRFDPRRRGIVLQAPLNALVGTGGTLYADLGPVAPAATGAAMEEISQRLPAGLHLALSLSERGGAAPIGNRLASSGFQADQGWDATAAMVQAGSDAPDGAVQTLLLPPPQQAGSAPAPANPPQGAGEGAGEGAGQNAGGRAPPDPASAAATPATAPAPAAPNAAAAPPPAEADPATHAEPAGPAPETPPQPPAPARSADAPNRTGGGAGSARIRRLQAALARNGYGGPVDGRLKGPTVAAIRTFQRDLGNPETGVLTQAELVRLLNR